MISSTSYVLSFDLLFLTNLEPHLVLCCVCSEFLFMFFLCQPPCIKGSFFFLSKIFSLLEVDELSFCVHKFVFLQLCYFLLFRVVSELYYFVRVSDSNASVFSPSLTLNFFQSVTGAGVSLTCMYFSW